MCLQAMPVPCVTDRALLPYSGLLNPQTECTSSSMIPVFALPRTLFRQGTNLHRDCQGPLQRKEMHIVKQLQQH